MTNTETERRSSSDSATREFVILNIADQQFGVEVTDVHDVFVPTGLAHVPLGPPEIAGVLNLRGRIVTAVDARARLGLPSLEDNAKNAMAVGIEKDGESYGLVIDGVGEVLQLSDKDYEPNPCNLDSRWQAVARGVYRLDGRLVIVLDIDRMLEFDAAVAA